MRRTTFARLAIAPLLALALGGCSESTAPGVDEAAPEARLQNSDFTQIDRMGLPAIATVFIPSAKRDSYNTADPRNDRRDYLADVVSGLTAFGHPDPNGLASALLPDIMPFNTGSAAGFLNGRRLADDVITAELGLIFGNNAALNDDHVDANDRPFPGVFPFLAGPHRS
jgi:hypothetical protein